MIGYDFSTNISAASPVIFYFGILASTNALISSLVKNFG